MKTTIAGVLLILVLSVIHQPMWAAAVAALLVIRWAFRNLLRSLRRR
ncbi:hypothetical protein ACVXZ4_08300 [Lacisediminihabitans sp. FW035]